MVTAHDLRAGMAIRLDGESWRVTEAESHAGTAKMSGFVHARLLGLGTGALTDRRFRLEEKLEEVELVKRSLEFSYHAGDDYTFMDPATFDQYAIPAALIGPAHRFLTEGMRLPVEFLGDEPVTVTLPLYADLRVASTAAPMHATQTSARKDAILENGLHLHVPLFIAAGEMVRVQIATDRYVERVREGKH